MELAILVWVIDILISVDTILGLVVGLIIVLPCLAWLCILLSTDSLSEAKESFKNWFYPLTLGCTSLIAILIPAPKVMMYIGGAYLVQSTFESEFVQETATLSQKAIINQLTVWSDESPELVHVLKEIGVQVKEKLEEVEDTTQKENTK